MGQKIEEGIVLGQGWAGTDLSDTRQEELNSWRVNIQMFTEGRQGLVCLRLALNSFLSCRLASVPQVPELQGYTTCLFAETRFQYTALVGLELSTSTRRASNF